MQEILKRAQSETPKFFRVLRTIGLVVATVGGGLLAAPVVLPSAVVTLGGYLAVAGSVLGAVSQLTVQAPKGDGTP